MCAAAFSPGVDGQGLPYSLEAEQSVLGAILLDANCLPQVRGIVRKAEYFYLAQHRAIYTQMCTLEDMRRPVDIVTVLGALQDADIYDEAAGKTYLTQLIQMVPSIAHVAAYAAIVRDRYDLRTLISASREVIDLAADGQAEADAVLEAAEQSIFAIREGRDASELRHIGSVIVETYDWLHQMSSDETGEFAPISTGFSSVDAVITGLNKSDLIILGARPGMGKTSFALNVALNVAALQKKTVVFFSLEMSCVQLVLRLLASEARIPGQTLMTGRLSGDQWTSLAEAASMLHNTSLYFDENPNITVPQIKAKVRRLARTCPVDLVVIDYLGLMKTDRRIDNRVQEVSEITRTLKIMAKELQVPVLTLAQLSRVSEQRAEHKPQLSDLRDSGSIEQDADLVMFLYRQTYYQQPGEEGEGNPNLAELIVAKNRRGAVDSIPMHWDGQFTRFTPQEYVRRDG